MKEDPEIDFESTVSYLLAKVSTAFRNSLERHMGEIGLHGGQVFVLFELWRNDGLRQVELANRLNLSPPTVNKMIKGLMDIRLVVSQKVEDDGRATRIYLTSLGRTMRHDISGQWLELEQVTLAGLTETERLVLGDLLSKLRASYTGDDPDAEDGRS